MSELIKILKIAALVAGILMILKLLGSAIDSVVTWTWLTTIFSILRYLWNSMDWIINAPILITCIGLTLTLDIAENIFQAGYLPIHWFKK
jgi:hypothetical protein